MAAIDHESNFDKIIDARLRSDDWNMAIARSLIERKRRKKYKLLAVGLALTFGSAVLIMGRLVPQSPTLPSEGEELNNFIQAQVDGTWKRNAGGTLRIDNREIFIASSQYDTSLDEIIEEALSERF